MISAFKNAGTYYLGKQGYYDTDDEDEKAQIFLESQCMQLKDDWGRELVINLNTKTKKIEFLPGREIHEDKKSEFFAFSFSGNVAKKFFTTYPFEKHIVNTIPDTFKYLNNNEKLKGEIKLFFGLFEKLKDIFLIDESSQEKKYVLNPECLAKEQYKIFKTCMEELEKSKKTVKYKDVYSRFVYTLFPEYNKKNPPRIVTLKVNGNYIADTKYNNDYIKLLQYDLVNCKKVHKEDAVPCSICGKRSKSVFDNIPHFNIYGTTNPKYFENLKNKNAYKAFSICPHCYMPVAAGMKYLKDTFSDFIWETPVLLIPQRLPLDVNNDPFDYEKTYREVLRMFKGNKERGDLTRSYEIFKKGIKKNLVFDLLFYFEVKAQFNVCKHISYIEFSRLHTLFSQFHEYNSLYPDLHFPLQLYDFRVLLFPNKRSHKNIKKLSELVRKNVLDFYTTLLRRTSLLYKSLISQFTDIFRREFHNKKPDKKRYVSTPLRMNILLSLLFKYIILKGADMGKKGNTITKIMNKDYVCFFDVHSELYANNFYRQGLFLLGVLINKIVIAQKDKSSSFLTKINYSGIHPRRIMALVNDVKNYHEIYKKDIYHEPELWAQTMDRLQGIEQSGLGNDETVFYILSGISYSQYLGMKYSKEKQLKSESKGE